MFIYHWFGGLSAGVERLRKSNNATGADGEEIAALRKGRASLEFIWAAAHWLCAKRRIEQ